MKGEFEKRMRTWEEFRINGSLRLTIHNILEIVDEARKEFPNAMFKGNEDYSTMNRTQMFNQFIRIYDWKKKWFGSGESEEEGVEK